MYTKLGTEKNGSDDLILNVWNSWEIPQLYSQTLMTLSINADNKSYCELQIYTYLQ